MDIDRAEVPVRILPDTPWMSSFLFPSDKADRNHDEPDDERRHEVGKGFGIFPESVRFVASRGRHSTAEGIEPVPPGAAQDGIGPACSASYLSSAGIVIVTSMDLAGGSTLAGARCHPSCTDLETLVNST